MIIMKKVMAMFALLMIALSVAGFAYATWSDSVQIEGTVEMGELIFGILDNSVTTWDNEPGLPVPKDVADCWAVLDDFETSVHHEPPETVAHVMYITVDNAYPQYEQWIKFALKNAGTIPVHIIEVTITGYDETDMEVLTYDPVAGGFVDPVQGLIINFDFYKQATLDPVEPCQQIDPCTEEWVEIYMDFKEEAEPCHTYTFKIYIEAVQWNKA